MRQEGIERYHPVVRNAFHRLSSRCIPRGVDGTATSTMLSLRRSPSRDAQFRAWAFLPMQDPEAAAQELVPLRPRTRLRRRPYRVQCAWRLPARCAVRARSTDAALDLDVPLFVHPADPPGKERTREYELTVVAGYLFDNTINILKMVCSGFLDRWPRLKLICRPYRCVQSGVAGAHAAGG